MYSDWELEVGCTTRRGRAPRAQSQLETAKPLSRVTELRFSNVISAKLEQTKNKADSEDIQYSNTIGRVFLLQSINPLSRSTIMQRIGPERRDTER